MNKELFREKNVKRVSSPEQLNDYMRVTSPGIWAIIIAVIMLLAGAVIWGVTGTVTIVDDNDNEYEVHPITFVIN